MYDYDKNIKVTTTPKGDKVITMNEAIFVTLLNTIYNGMEYLENKELKASAKDILKLWQALNEKGDE